MNLKGTERARRKPEPTNRSIGRARVGREAAACRFRGRIEAVRASPARDFPRSGRAGVGGGRGQIAVRIVTASPPVCSSSSSSPVQWDRRCSKRRRRDAKLAFCADVARSFFKETGYIFHMKILVVTAQILQGPL
jgi:hypothetical protein